MATQEPSFIKKLQWNLPWLVRYPWTRTRSFLERVAFERKHLVFVVANHFEPGWAMDGILDHKTQMSRLKAYRSLARETGGMVLDSDGTKFRHTNFYPAEQYHPEILDVLAEMQADGLGEIEVHLHHGVDKPDTAENLACQLVEFRDTVAEQHKGLSRVKGRSTPMYAFVHGNLALANSCGGRFCGVDNEMEILRDTGCYADMTLPSAPDQSQVAIINQIYECGLPLDEAVPHRDGRRVSADGTDPQLPLIFNGPLVLSGRLPVPRLDDGALTAKHGLEFSRLSRWISANVTVDGRGDWVFIKLYCHGFFDQDQSACIGADAQRFFGEVVEQGERTGKYKTHFASAREAFNMVAAAIDGHSGDPNTYRDYKLEAIMQEAPRSQRQAAARVK